LSAGLGEALREVTAHSLSTTGYDDFEVFELHGADDTTATPAQTEPYLSPMKPTELGCGEEQRGDNHDADELGGEDPHERADVHAQILSGRRLY